MDIKKFMKNENEKPLDNVVSNGGFCAIFRTIGCIGDSLSSGELEAVEAGTRRYFDFYENSWGQFMARDCGCKVYNFSRGGMSAREYCNSFADANGFFDIEKRCQAYIIAMGVNDISMIINNELEFGEISDVNPKNYSLNKPTFAGYMGMIISKYKEIQPHAKFFLMTCPHCHHHNKERDDYNTKHSELMYQLSELFSNCYVLDLRKYGPDYDKEFYNNFFLCGHLNNTGYRLTALMVESYIDYIIRNNPDDFRQAGFIGKLHYSSEK